MISIRTCLLIQYVLCGTGEHAQEFDESLTAVQVSKGLKESVRGTQVGRDQPENETQNKKKSSREVARRPPPKLRNRGCALLCVNKDVVRSNSVQVYGNDSFECRDIEGYLLHDAAREDCMQLVEHFAPLCCKSQLGHVPLNVSKCEECDGGCILNGFCAHSFGGWKFKKKQCVQHQGKWCGSTDDDDGDEAILEEIEDEEYIDEDENDDGSLNLRVPPADEEMDEIVSGSNTKGAPTTDPNADDASVLMQGNTTGAVHWHSRRRLFSLMASNHHCESGDVWMSSKSNSQGELEYHNSEYCAWKIERPVAVSLLAFETETAYDKLTVKRKTFSGSFQEVQPELDGLLLDVGDVIKWSADSLYTNKGWKLMVSPFEKMGKGKCGGWNSVRNTLRSVSLEHAFDECLNDEHCLYLGYEPPPHYTTLYGEQAKECSLYDANTEEVVYRKVERKWPCCRKGDNSNFVHKGGQCRSAAIYLRTDYTKSIAELSLERNRAGRYTMGPNVPVGKWITRHWGPIEGRGRVDWKCYRRRRVTYSILGRHGSWESNDFVPPNNGARIFLKSGGSLSFHPFYCPPPSISVPTSPANRECCSVSDGTIDACNEANFVKVKVNDEWKKCYKGQTCEYEFDEPVSRGVGFPWYCGENFKESVTFGLYYDTLQVKLECDGTVRWNPWWCGRATEGKAPPSLPSSLAQLLEMKAGAELTTSEVQSKLDDWVLNNKGTICQGISDQAVYDQLLKPSGICWRSGHEGRTSLFMHHSDSNPFTSLHQEGTALERSERKHSSPWRRVLEMLQRNTTLLELAASANEDPVSLRELKESVNQAVEMSKLSSGGVECDRIGKTYCTTYCTLNDEDCARTIANKIDTILNFLIELASEIAMAISTGGAANVAKATAKKTAKMALQKAANQGFKSTVRNLGKKYAQLVKDFTLKHAKKFGDLMGRDKAASYLSKQYSQHLKHRLQGRVMKKYTYTWEDAAKDMYKETQDRMKEALGKSLLKVSCESTISAMLAEKVDDPDWVTDPSFKWGNGNGFGGYLEVMDITGIVSLVGAFYESDCPAAIPGKENGISCPR